MGTLLSRTNLFLLITSELLCEKHHSRGITSLELKDLLDRNNWYVIRFIHLLLVQKIFSILILIVLFI
jgi:hypothetical protein